MQDATIHAADDMITQAGTLILNDGSASQSGHDWGAGEGGRIIVNGGLHRSASGTSHRVGAQDGGGVDFLGGVVSAGDFSFQAGSSSRVGGSAILRSTSAATSFNDMSGLVNFSTGWTGSWELASFSPGSWFDALTITGNFTLNGSAIHQESFDFRFAVSPDGKTLTMVEPSGFFAWQIGYGIEGKASGCDSDNDGLADLIEYACGGNPLDPQDHPRPSIFQNRYSIYCLSTLTDVEWTVESSIDLETWNPRFTVSPEGMTTYLAPGYRIESDGGEPAFITVLPPDESNHEFFRLKVTFH